MKLFKSKRNSGKVDKDNTGSSNGSPSSPTTEPSATSPTTSTTTTTTTNDSMSKESRKLSVRNIFKKSSNKDKRLSVASNMDNVIVSDEGSDVASSPSDVTSDRDAASLAKTPSSTQNGTEAAIETYEPAALGEPVNIHQKYASDPTGGTEALSSTHSDTAGNRDSVELAQEADVASATTTSTTVMNLPAFKRDDKKWIRKVIEYVANVKDGEVMDLCYCSAVSRTWYSVAASDKLWQPLVEYQMRERGYSHSARKSNRSKYLAMINKEYETLEPESDDEDEDGPVVRVTPDDVDNVNNNQRKETPVLSPSVHSPSDSLNSDDVSSPVSPSTNSKDKALEPVDPAPYYSTDYQAITYKEDPEENIEWAMEDGKNQIECATLNKLVEMLTHHKEYDIFFMQTFILTFRSFTDQKTLVDKLIERFNMPPPRPDISHEEFAIFKKEKLDKVRLRVTSTLKYWLESFYLFDFAEEEMLKRFNEMVDVMEKSNSAALANMLKRTLEKVRGDINIGRVMTEVKCPDIMKPKKGFFGKKKKFDILHYPLLEVARQITLLDYDIFVKIEPKECLNQSWNKEYRVTKAPNINDMIQTFNKLSNWVGTEIVQQEDLEKRAAVMEKMIELANHCKELNNFNGLFSVISGLNLASIFRLKNTWAAISEEHRNMYTELNKYISRDFNFRYIRNALKNVKPPCIPYIGLYLTDLTFIEEGNPKYINQKINFVRCRRFAEVIRDMQTYQNTRYALHPYPELQDMIKNIQNVLPEEEMYQQSLKVEERQKSKKKKAA